VLSLSHSAFACALSCSPSVTGIAERPFRVLEKGHCYLEVFCPALETQCGDQLTGGGACLILRSASMCVSLSSLMKVSAQFWAVWV
jgi:hypothetical protein